MARYTGPVCRLCRRHGLKLFLKGERCFRPKCAVERRHSRQAITASGGARSPSTRTSSRRSRRRATSTACSSGSSASTSPPPSAARASPAKPAAGARNAAGQRGVSARLRRLAERRPASLCGTATSRSTAAEPTSPRRWSRPATPSSVMPKARQLEYFKIVQEGLTRKTVPPWLSSMSRA